MSPTRPLRTLALSTAAALFTTVLPLRAAEPVSYSGIYPSLTMYNHEGECGTGAVVPWADRLWVITYGPHKPKGSTDKLYEISPALEQTIRPESVGGTPADRLIHRESHQLVIGPYFIDEKGGVRVIPPAQMYGRLTAAARHLLDPENKVYLATMEEGIYEADVHSLAVTELWADQQLKEGRHSGLPGYHGKGLYSGQGVLVYANNGEHGHEAETNPDASSGILAEWDGKSDAWKVIRRNQFTDLTGPGGLNGAEHPETDPIWAIGWDARSLLLNVRENGAWQTFRLPKATHTYDGAHGWHTEWPRIREIGEKDLLMTMHGTFWRFPANFSAAHSAGLAPRSTFLKVTGDFARWGDRIVVGCDDTAVDQFTNKRAAKGTLAGPAQSQSNLWFLQPEQLDHLGPVTGTGAVWLKDAVPAGAASDPFLFSGYARRGLHLSTGQGEPVKIALEVSPGDGTWQPLRTVTVSGYAWLDFPATETGAWVRLRPEQALPSASAVFSYASADPRAAEPAPLFDGLARPGDDHFSAGTLLAGGEERHELAFAASAVTGGKVTGENRYELTYEKGALRLAPRGDAAALAKLKAQTAVPGGILKTEASSILYLDDQGHRWRLPRTDDAYDREPVVPLRLCREVSTERDLFQAHGTFYELPAVTSGGFAKVRPITSHHRLISDYASWRGLLVLSGLSAATLPAQNTHLISAQDGACALWAGAFDDLWQLGKAVGHGGPWLQSAVKAGEPSDPYLMRNYDRKRLELSQQSEHPVQFTMEVDPYGRGDWQPYQTFAVKPGEITRFQFPDAFNAYWVRFVSQADCTASTVLTYE